MLDSDCAKKAAELISVVQSIVTNFTKRSAAIVSTHVEKGKLHIRRTVASRLRGRIDERLRFQQDAGFPKREQRPGVMLIKKPHSNALWVREFVPYDNIMFCQGSRMTLLHPADSKSGRNPLRQQEESEEFPPCIIRMFPDPPAPAHTRMRNEGNSHSKIRGKTIVRNAGYPSRNKERVPTRQATERSYEAGTLDIAERIRRTVKTARRKEVGSAQRSRQAGLGESSFRSTRLSSGLRRTVRMSSGTHKFATRNPLN